MRPDDVQVEEWETRSLDFETRAEVSDDRKIRGYALVFNKLSDNLGGFRERILPSAVDRTLREGLDVRAYIEHDPSKVIGRKSAGTLKLAKDKRGLFVVIDPPDTTMANDLMRSIDRGDISGMSFRFKTIEDDWRMENGIPTRDLVDMLIREVSVVSEPAYPDTSVAVRSLTAFQGSRRGMGWYDRRMKAAGIRA